MAKGGNNPFALLPDDNDGDIDGFINEVVAQAKIREEEMQKKQQLQEQEEEAAKIKEQQKVEAPKFNPDPIPKRKPSFGSYIISRKIKPGIEVQAQTQGNVQENHQEKVGSLENNQNVVNNNHKGKGNYRRNYVSGDNGYQGDYNRVDNRRNFNDGDQKFNGYQRDNNVKNFNGGDQGYNGNQRDVRNFNGGEQRYNRGGDQGYNGNQRDVRNFNGGEQRYNRGGEVYYRENYRNLNRGDNGYRRSDLSQRGGELQGYNNNKNYRKGNFNQQNNYGDKQNGVVYCEEPDAEGYMVYRSRRKGRRFHGNMNVGSSEHNSNTGTDDLVQFSGNAEKNVVEEGDKPEEKVVVEEGDKPEAKLVVEEAAESKNGEKEAEKKADAESKEEEEEDKKEKKKKPRKKKNSKAGDLYQNKNQQQRQEDKNFQANTKTYKEYEKLLLAKKKALEDQLATNTFKPKASLDEAFASMKPIGKANEKPKVSSATAAESLKNRERGTKSVNITADFIKPPLRRFYRRGVQVEEDNGGPNVDSAPPSTPSAAAAPALPPPCVNDLDQFPSL